MTTRCPVALFALLVVLTPTLAHAQAFDATPYAGHYVLADGRALAVTATPTALRVRYTVPLHASPTPDLAANLAADLGALWQGHPTALVEQFRSTAHAEAERSLTTLGRTLRAERGALQSVRLLGDVLRPDGTLDRYAEATGTRGTVTLRLVYADGVLTTVTCGTPPSVEADAYPVARHRFVVADPEAATPSLLTFVVDDTGAVRTVHLEPDALLGAHD